MFIYFVIDIVFIYFVTLCYICFFDKDTTSLHRADFIIPMLIWSLLNASFYKLYFYLRKQKKVKRTPIKFSIKPIKLKPVKIKQKHIVILLLALLLILPIRYTYNRIILNGYVQKINNVELPAGCIVTSSDKAIGKFYGNDNKNDFIVYYVVKTDMTEQQLIDYFKTVKLPAADSSNRKSSVIINRQPDNLKISVPEDCTLIVFADEGGKHF